MSDNSLPGTRDQRLTTNPSQNKTSINASSRRIPPDPGYQETLSAAAYANFGKVFRFWDSSNKSRLLTNLGLM